MPSDEGTGYDNYTLYNSSSLNDSYLPSKCTSLKRIKKVKSNGLFNKSIRTYGEKIVALGGSENYIRVGDGDLSSKDIEVTK